MAPARLARALLIVVLSVASIARAAEPSATESARIEYLLAVVGSMHDAWFIRNGTAYDSATAVSHLRTKLRAAGARVQTAEDFIRYCATESSITGQPYEIRFADGRTTPAADFLSRKLVEFDQGSVPGG